MVTSLFKRADAFARRKLAQTGKRSQLSRERGLHVNLCSGDVLLPGFCNVDVAQKSDLVLDLEKELMPFADASVERLVCISAINYFERPRALEIVRDVHRVLVLGGRTRFGTQDLELIAQKYVDQDREFFFQKGPDGKDRFEGRTFADKFNSWFYGYKVYGTKHCKYVYDYETLALLFKEAGFEAVERKKYRESPMPDIDLIDNRPDQMFFLEAVK